MVAENGRLPKKPFDADRGDGWTLVSTRWRSRSMTAPLSWALRPQRMKTRFSRSRFSAEITASVKGSHPLP